MAIAYGIVLYGSEARGEATAGSDLDILVLLKGPVSLGKDLRKIINALYPLQLEIDRAIHAMPVDVDIYEAAEFALYRNVRFARVTATVWGPRWAVYVQQAY